MSDSFESFISELEASAREKELTRLLAEKTPAQEDVRLPTEDVSVLSEDVIAVNISTVASEELLKKAGECAKDVDDCEKELHTHMKTLSYLTSQRPSDKEWLKPLLEKGKEIAAQSSEVESSADMLQDALSKASELYDEAKRRNQEAAASFSMTELVAEINMIQEQRKLNGDLVAENEALWALVEDLDKDVENMTAEAQREEEEIKKMAEEREKVKAQLADIEPRIASLAEALSKATEEEERLEKELSEAQAAEERRRAREKVVLAILDQALAEKAAFEAKVEVEMARYMEEFQRVMDDMGDLERAMAETKVIGDRKIAEILDKKDAFSREWAVLQKEVDSVCSIRKQCLDEEAAEATFADDLEDVEKQIANLKGQIQKRMDKKELFSKKIQVKLNKKVKQVEELEAELVDTQAKFNDDAAVFKEKTEALQKICLDLRNEADALTKEAEALEDTVRRAQIVVGQEAVSGENASPRSRNGSRATEGTANKLSKNSPRFSRGSNTTHSKPPSKKAVRKTHSFFNPIGQNTSKSSSLGNAVRNDNQPSPPPRKIVRQDDSLLGNGDDSNNNSSFDLSFGSSVFESKESNAPPPPVNYKNTARPAVSMDSTLVIDPSQFTTSTPMSKKGTTAALHPLTKSQSVPRSSRGRRNAKK